MTEFHGQSLTVVPKLCFKGCTSLRKVIIPNCKEIEESAFYQISCTECIHLPSLKIIGDNAFRKSYELNVRFGPLERIGDFAFADVRTCTFNFIEENFTSKVIGRSILDQAKICFKGACFDLSVESDMNYIANYAKRIIDYAAIEDLSCGFILNDETEMAFPNLKTARDFAFGNLTNLRKLELPNLQEVYGGLAYNCSNLVHLVTPNLRNVTNGKLFFGCNNITDRF